MEEPEREISSIITRLTTTCSPDVQRETVLAYMTRDVAFEHPVCSVQSRPNSRETLLKIYQWYRVLSPQIDLSVDHVVFDTRRNVMYVEATQVFKLFFLPVRPLPARLVVRLELRKVRSLYFIARQDDFYHTSEFVRLLIPPLAPVVDFLLVLATLLSYLGAMLAQRMGFWTPHDDSRTYPGDHRDLYEMNDLPVIPE